MEVSPNLLKRGGKKGRSGRKSARVELAKDEAIRKAWFKVAASVDSSDVKEIALPLALKDMVIKSDDKVSLIVQQITGMKITKDNGTAIPNENPKAD